MKISANAFKEAQKWQRRWDGVGVRIVDDDGMKYHRQFVQDVEPIINNNTRIRNETNGKVGEGRRVGSIPTTIVYDKIREWTAQGRLDPNAPTYSLKLNNLLKELLRDRDYAKFRTTDKT